MAWIARLAQVCHIVSEWDGHCLRYGAGVLMECAWPEHVRADDADAWKSLDVVGVNIGVRPARAGGARVALDEQPLEMHGRRVGVIHAYGIGPAGYQASHGIAAEVCEWADRWEAQARRAHL